MTRRCAGTRTRNLNKDDYQVGVRAIDRDGNKSPVAYPIPANAYAWSRRCRQPLARKASGSPSRW